MKDGKTIAIVPGSFDPITYGHIDIAKRAAQSYDEVYLAVMINDQKKYMFSIEERANIASLALKDVGNVNVITSEGMLWRLAKELEADAIVKGYRNQTDYEYEIKMAEFNSAHYPNAQTVLIEANESLELLSSTLVRQKLHDGQPISDFLPPDAEEAVYRILKTRENNFS